MVDFRKPADNGHSGRSRPPGVVKFHPVPEEFLARLAAAETDEERDQLIRSFRDRFRFETGLTFETFLASSGLVVAVFWPQRSAMDKDQHPLTKETEHGGEELAGG
jgi:hypothetical protein